MIYWKSDSQHIVENLEVLNDSAERGVKLCCDFLDSARYVIVKKNRFKNMKHKG